MMTETGVLSARQKVVRALAEIGYPEKYVQGTEEDPEVFLKPFGVEPRDCWMAFRVAGIASACWACWNDGDGDECDATLNGMEDCGRDRCG